MLMYYAHPPLDGEGGFERSEKPGGVWQTKLRENFAII